MVPWGLHRLIDNGYSFTISKRAEDNLTKAMQDGNNIIVFMQSEGYIRRKAHTPRQSSFTAPTASGARTTSKSRWGSAGSPITCGRTRSGMGWTIPIISQSGQEKQRGDLRESM